MSIGAQFDGHLILVGLPGSGKSTIGRAVAGRLSRPFLDFDTEIERRAGRSVARIFAEMGEPPFREMEVSLTRELAAAPPMVLAPGGGWVTNAGVMELLRPPGRIVHLLVSPREAVRRLSRARIVRPLLQGTDPAGTVEALWGARAGLYSRADLEINVELVDSHTVIKRVVALACDLTLELG
ncbi:MAG TPA: shikimate kinase [Gemmatimonas sp.]|nr:shikimate kinase [Gemmatimonas sp.]